jgi:hypothetical protein
MQTKTIHIPQCTVPVSDLELLRNEIAGALEGLTRDDAGNIDCANPEQTYWDLRWIAELLADTMENAHHD